MLALLVLCLVLNYTLLNIFYFKKTKILGTKQLLDIKRVLLKHKNNKYRIGEFTKSSMQPFKIKDLPLKSIFDAHSMLQYKGNLKDSSLGKDISKCLGKVMKQHPEYSYTVRICSSPWYFEAHFDCDTNQVIILHGAKRFLLFDIRDNLDKMYLNKIRGKNILESKKILQSFGIKTTIRNIFAGETIHIPPNAYHKVESIGQSKFSVLLNINGNNSKYINSCSRKFDTLWKKQGELCDSQECFY